jgi:putative transposase
VVTAWAKERVRRLVKKHGVCARSKRKFVVTTDSKHHFPIAPVLLQRNFTPSAPNQVWTGDMTYIATDEGWLYLAAVLDLFNRQVMGWSMRAPMQSGLATDALTMAWWRRRPDAGAVFHSDRGRQYCGHEFQNALKG